MSALPPSHDLGQFLERVVVPPTWRVVYEPVVESTMNLAVEAARRGWPDRSVFVCDYQTAGRGREQRAWLAPPGTGLLFTVLLRSTDSPLAQTMLASVALSEAIERLALVEPSIKWPNDLMIEERKLAGILAEIYSDSSSSYVLIGCGVNVNQELQHLTAIGRNATSLKLETGRHIHRGELLVLCLERFDRWLCVNADDRIPNLRQEWERRLWGRGERVRLLDRGLEFSAIIESVALDGSLLVRLDSGELRPILVGEIVL